MAFGKRTAVPASDAKRVPAVSPAAEVPPSRLQDLSDQLGALLGEARRIADAIRDETSINMPAVLDEPDPEAGPLPIRGFYLNFITGSRPRFGHVIFAYRNPAEPRGADPNAQYHLQQLTGQVLAFNVYCQRAQLDGALGVALQSPDVPHAIDSILVRAAFFAAFFSNMAGDARPGSEPDLARQRANLDRHLLMAMDKMIMPKLASSYLPQRSWPFVGLEVPMIAHEGDHFINGVYFPADYARILIAQGGEVGDRLPMLA